MKRIISLITVFVVAFSFNVNASDISRIVSDFNQRISDFVPIEYKNSEHIFNDIIGVSWAQESIYCLAEKGIVNGIGYNQFAPDENVTRSQFLKMILTASGLVEENAYSEALSGWERPYIFTAEKYGISRIFDDDDYSKPITREEMVYVAGTALSLCVGEFTSGYTEMFLDDAFISSMAKKYVYILKDLKIINGYPDGSFLPKSTATRSEAAVIVYNFLKVLDQEL